MTKRKPSSEKAAKKTTTPTRVLPTPVLLALFAPAPLAAASAGSGAPFLSGALTAQQVAAPSVDTAGKGGFIMKDTIIIRTGG